jgi:hypothetical protein
MIRLQISAEAYDAIAQTLALGTVAAEPKRAENGDIYIWLDPRVLAKLKALRGPGESYSDVIIRAARGAWCRKSAVTLMHTPAFGRLVNDPKNRD